MLKFNILLKSMIKESKDGGENEVHDTEVGEGLPKYSSRKGSNI